MVSRPSFLFATSRIISGHGGGLAGVHAMWAGENWQWHRWVRRNEAITTEATWKQGGGTGARVNCARGREPRRLVSEASVPEIFCLLTLVASYFAAALSSAAPRSRLFAVVLGRC